MASTDISRRISIAKRIEAAKAEEEKKKASSTSSASGTTSYSLPTVRDTLNQTTTQRAQNLQQQNTVLSSANPFLSTNAIPATATADEKYERLASGLASGDKLLASAQEELDQMRSTYATSPLQTWTDAYDQRMAAFQNNLKTYNDMVEQYNYYNTAAGIKERADALLTKRDAAQSAYAQVRKDNPMIQGQRDNAAAVDAAKAEYDKYSSSYQNLINLYYQVENQEKQEGLQSDAALSGQYSTAQELQEDMDRVTALMAYTTDKTGDAAAAEEARQYLMDKYGLDQKAIDQYAISGTSYVSRADGGYASLYELYQELQEKQKAAVETLAGAGYDYARMAEYEQMQRDAAAYAEKTAAWEDYAREHPILSSLDSVLVSPFQGVDYLKTMAGGIGSSDTGDLENYVPLNVYNMDATNMVNTVRGTIASDLEESTDWEILGQNVASFLYQTGMSIADSTVQVAALGNGATLLMGASAASSQAKAIIEKGGTNAQAFWGGLAAGAAETIFEKFSIDRLLSPKSVTSVKSLLAETLKQAGTEASEEVLTEVSNILSDAIIMGQNSDFNLAVEQYKLIGLSEEEAKQQALLDCIGQVAWAGVGGALSGAAMGGTVNSINLGASSQATRAQCKAFRQMGDDVVQAILQEGLDSAPSTKSYQMATKLQSRQEQGKTASGKDLGRLYQENVKTVEAEQAAQENARAVIRETLEQAREQMQPQLYDMADQLQQKADRGETITQEEITQLEQARALLIGAETAQTEQTAQATTGTETGAENGLEGASGQNKTASAGETESTAVNTNPAEHTQQEQAVIDAYQDSTDEVLKEAFESHLNNPRHSFSRYNIGTVSERQAEDAAQILGGNYAGYRNAINSNAINHVLNDHGPNGKADHSMADLNDAARIAYVLDNYDSVEQVTYSSGDADLSAEFRTGDNQPAPMLKYRKKVNGTYYVVEAVPESKYKKFWVVSAYMETDGGTQAPDAQGPRNTPNTSLASSPSVSSDTTIPQQEPGVKSQSAPNTEEYLTPTELKQREELPTERTVQNNEQAGENVSDGGQGRVSGPGAGEQAGGVAAGAKRAGQTSEQLRTAVERQNRVQALRGERVSSLDLGVEQGTDEKTVQIAPEEVWDDAMQATAERIFAETGKEVTYVIGGLPLDTPGGTTTVRGVYSQDGVIVQADHMKLNIDQIADHEIFHDKAFQTPGLVRELEERIVERFGREDFERVVDTYVEHLRGVIDIPENASQDEIDAALLKIYEEIMADAYAGINFFGAHAERYNETVEQGMEERGAGRSQENAAATERTTGPPEERYSTQEDDPGRGDAQEEITARYKQDVAAILDGTRKGSSSVLMGYTPAVLEELGAPSLPFVIGAGRVSCAAKRAAEAKADGRYNSRTHYHGLGAGVIGDLYEFIQDPYCVIASEDVSASFPVRSQQSVVVIIDVGAGGDSLLMPVQITTSRDVNGQNMDVNLLSSAYEKNATALIQKAVASENAGFPGVFYISNEAAASVAFKGLIPKAAYGASASGTILHQIGAKVNLKIQEQTQSQQFKDWFGDWQNDPTRASKVVNEDGTPRIVYHGTNQNFWTFDTESKAYWFSESEDYAEAMMEERGGERMIPAYLNMRNPYRATLEPGQFSDPGYEKPILDRARAGGHDGVIIKNNTDDAYAADTFYVVFDSAQIKSADSNVGTFDRKNPDIRYSVDDETADDLKQSQWEIIRESNPMQDDYHTGIRSAEEIKTYPEALNDEEWLLYDGFSPDYTWNMAQDAEASGTIKVYSSYPIANGVFVTPSRMEAQDYAGGGKVYEKTVKLTDVAWIDPTQGQYARVQESPNTAREGTQRYSVDDDGQRKKPIAESKPIIAKNDLRGTLLSLFSIPGGTKAELGRVIDQYADRLLKNGALTEDDRTAFFDRMYNSGLVEVAADEYASQGRQRVRGGRIYVNDAVRQEFGDDWNAFRRQAFGAGVYLTGNTDDMGVDVWNAELAEDLPGMFRADDLDSRDILERIVRIAEEGKGENMSLPDYISSVIGEEFISEQEALDNIERQFDWALRTFAEKANLEIKLRDRTGVKIAQEREPAAQ